MSNEDKYIQLFQAGCGLIDGLIRLDGQQNKKVGFFEKLKLKKAQKIFKQSIHESPTNAAPFLMLAKISEKLNLQDESLDWLQKAWNLEPGNLILLVELSGALGSMGKHKEAIHVLTQAKENYPEEPRVIFNLGISYLFENQAKKAIDCFSKAVELEPEYPLNKKLLKYSSEVAEGKKPKPKTQSDISKNI